MKIFRTSKRLGRLAFTLSSLAHIAVLALVIFLAKKAVESWPSMGPKAGGLIMMQELQSSAASSEEAAAPVPPPEKSDMPTEEVRKEPEPQPEPEAVRANEAKETVASTGAQTAQIAQSPGASADIEAAVPVAGRGDAGKADWQTLAIAQVRALVEHEKYYPVAAQKAGYTGRFVVLIGLEPAGRIVRCEIVEHRGHPLLAKALDSALEKVRGRNIGMNLPKPFVVRLPIEFELK